MQCGDTKDIGQFKTRLLQLEAGVDNLPINVWFVRNR